MEKRRKEFKIGDRIIDYNEDGTVKRDLIIINKEKRDGCEYYKYHCNICKWNEGWIKKYHLINGIKCSCCSNSVVVKGINDMITIEPYVIKYLKNKEDGYKYTHYSGKKIWFKCPCCGYEKEMIVANFFKKGFYCPKCGDKVSYPEKLMFNLLEQLKQNKQLDDFVYQYTKVNSKWCEKYRYDFYFEKDGESYIIETHGEQHYKENSNFKMALEEVQENDKNKKELALQNGINPENYIVIDCKKSEFEFIKQNIINSILNNIFDLKKIDWIKCEEYTTKNLVKEVCNYWKIHNNINNENLTTTDLSVIFKRHRGTIKEYLQKGNKLNWCYYNEKEQLSKRSKMNGKNTGKPVEVFREDVSLGIFSSCRELEKNSELLFKIKLCQSTISKIARENNGQYKGYTFKYISREEYERRISEDPTLKESEQAS